MSKYFVYRTGMTRGFQLHLSPRLQKYVVLASDILCILVTRSLNRLSLYTVKRVV
jgi:hypothetical protein